ncbi:MAG: saccharopine dehydrogenase NADP-binding domain-containing protein [Vicinamibacteria bacterium]
MRALVLGAGRAGEAAALDLLGFYENETAVTVADTRAERLSELARRGSLLTRQIDLSEPRHVGDLVREFDVVVSALPARLGAGALRATIAANRLVADASAPDAEARGLDALAIEMEVAACVGCGKDGLARLLGWSGIELRAGREADAGVLDARVAGLMAAALARRLLTGDFRGHWGVWTPERLGARAGIAHGILEDLRARGLAIAAPST